VGLEGVLVSIGFYLMTEKGLIVLESVLQALGADQIEYVIGSAEDGMANDYRDAIAARCRQHGIAYFDRKDAFEPTAAYHFAVSWRWMIHNAPGLIVLHDSLLPKYRGFAPLPTALINGDRCVGVTALFASNEYDRGDILGQRKLAVTYPAKIRTVISALSAEYADLVIDICRRIQAGAKLTGTPQNEAEASYSLWRDEEDYRIDWSSDAERLKRFIDSVGSPYKGRVRLHGRTPSTGVRRRR
jgi:methionyl-tRNA formyltransferase